MTRGPSSERAEYPDRFEEWDAYLASLRTVADEEGAFPETVQGLISDVFYPLIGRAAAGAPTTS